MFNLWIEVETIPLIPPRQNHDDWIMLIFVNTGYSDDELIWLYRVQCHQHILFYSNIFDAGGRAIDHQYLAKRPLQLAWLRLIFPLENPPARNFHLWWSTIDTIAPRGRPRLWLGWMINKRHKFWEWRFDGESLCHLSGNKMDIYAPLVAMGNNCNNNRCTCSLRRQPQQDTGYLCFVTINTNGEVAIRLQAEVAHPKTPPRRFWEVLQKWKRTWMWDNIQWVGDDNWIAGSIAARSCIAVTDGSYMKALYPNIHSAAFVLECTRGGG